MKVYLAHNYAAKEILKDHVVPLIEARGHFVTSRWIKEDMTDPLLSAVADLEDIDSASAIILYVDNEGNRPGKGKYFELGYAMRAGKRCILLGNDDSCVFYSLPNMRKAKTLEEAIKLI